MRKRISIAKRMSFSISGIVILVAVLALTVNYYLAVQTSKTRLENRINSQLHNLEKSLEVPLWHYDDKTIKHIGSAYASDAWIVLLRIVNEQQEQYFNYSLPDENKTIVRSVDIFHDGRAVGNVQIGLTQKHIWAITDRLLWSSIAIIILVVITLLLGTRIILHFFLKKPLADMSALAHAYADTTCQPFEEVDEYEEFKGLMTAMKDMSDRIRRQISELQESEDKFRSMAEYSPYPLFLVDRDLNISYINQKFQEVYGYKLSEISTLEEWWQQAYRNDEALEQAKAESLELFREALITRKKTGYTEKTITCKNGDQKVVEIAMVNISDMMLVHHIDLSRRKKMQEVMVQTEKLISVGGLAAGMAHEINNPLSAVMQGAQNVVRRFSPDMPKNQKAARKFGVDLEQVSRYMDERDIHQHLKGIRESGGRAAQIILNMLKFSRKSESNLAPVHIQTVLESAIDLAGNDYDLRKKFDFRHIELIREYDPQVDIVTCTETEMEQVILNLLKNAAQAIKEADMTEPPRIVLRTKRNGDKVRIEVEDNGPGMAEETRKRIFEPFYTTKPVGQGTGLGLHVSYMIVVNTHNGTMEVESDLDKGSRFIIEFPLNQT